MENNIKKLVITNPIGTINTSSMIKMYSGVDKKIDDNVSRLLEKGIGYKDILNLFTVEESIKIAYIPIIMLKIAEAYIDKVFEICKARKFEETKSFSRDYNTLKKEYYQVSFSGCDDETFNKLKNKADEFFDVNQRHVDTYYYVMSNKILEGRVREYIGDDNDKHDVIVFSACAAGIIEYIESFDNKSTEMINKRVRGTGCLYERLIGDGSRFIPYIKAFKMIMYYVIIKIYGRNDLKKSDFENKMTDLSIKVIAAKVNDIIKPVIESGIKKNEYQQLYKPE